MAADPTITAYCLDPIQLPLTTASHTRNRHQSGRRADLYTAAAVDTRRIDHGAVEGRGYVTLKPASDDLDGVGADNFITDAYTAAAENAVLVIADEKGIVILIQGARELEIMRGFLNVVFVGIILQKAVPCFVTGHAVQWMVGDK